MPYNFYVSSCLQVQKLVGVLEPWNFMTFHSLGNVMIPTDDSSIIFQRGRLNHQLVRSSYKFQTWPGRSTGHPFLFFLATRQASFPVVLPQDAPKNHESIECYRAIYLSIYQSFHPFFCRYIHIYIYSIYIYLYTYNYRILGSLLFLFFICPIKPIVAPVGSQLTYHLGDSFCLYSQSFYIYDQYHYCFHN